MTVKAMPPSKGPAQRAAPAPGPLGCKLGQTGKDSGLLPAALLALNRCVALLSPVGSRAVLPRLAEPRVLCRERGSLQGWGFTVFYENEKHEKQQWYLCCDTQADLREWFATFLHVQHGGALWPSETSKVRASRSQQDSRLGNISLIPLRGNESEMRNSVAAFATDPLTLLRNV